jgi:hypothetical protein
MAKLLTVSLPNGAAVEIDPDSERLAVSPVSVSLGAVNLTQQLFVIRHEGRQLAFLKTEIDSKVEANGDFIEGDPEQTLKRVLEKWQRFPSVYDLLGECLKRLKEQPD